MRSTPQVIQGADDPIFPPPTGLLAARALSHATLLTVDGMGHMPEPRLWGGPSDVGGVGRRGVVLDVALHVSGVRRRVQLTHQPQRHVDARRHPLT